MRNKKGSGIIMVIVAVFMVLWVAWSMVIGVMTLTGRGEAGDLYNVRQSKFTHVSGDVVAAVEVYEVKHTINYLIPTGKDYYYLLFGDDTMDKYCLVRASRSWYEDNFDDDGYAKGNVRVDGCISELSSDMRLNISKYNQEIVDYGISIDTNKFVDLNYKASALSRIIPGALIIIGVLLFVIAAVVTGTKFKLGGIGAVILFIGALFLAFGNH